VHTAISIRRIDFLCYVSYVMFKVPEKDELEKGCCIFRNIELNI